jgi:hypothetical protein
VALAFFRYFHTRSTFGSKIIVNSPVVYNEPRFTLSLVALIFCSRRGPAAAACNDDGVPVHSTIDCTCDGRLTILAKRTRAGANGGSAFWKEPAEETPTFLGTVRRMSLGPVFMRVAIAGSAQSNI